MDGNDVHFVYKALSGGDPLYSAYWDQVTEARDEYIFADVSEGLQCCQKWSVRTKLLNFRPIFLLVGSCFLQK